MLTVNKAALTITANNQSTTYGGAVPALGATYTGLVNGDTSGVVTGLVLSTTASSASPAGTYTITATGGLANNYTVTAGNGTLTVNKAALTITANNQSMTYGGTLPILTANFTGLVNGDTPSVVYWPDPLYQRRHRRHLHDRGQRRHRQQLHDRRCQRYADGKQGRVNHHGHQPEHDLRRHPAGITATFTGLVNGDSGSVVSGLVLTTTATNGSNVGTYTITATGGSASNYTITDGNGTLTVNKAVLTITANNKSMTAGSSVPTLDATYTGLVNGDTASVVSGLKLSTTATSSSPIGTYAITVTGGTAFNYLIIDSNGTLTVTKGTLSG